MLICDFAETYRILDYRALTPLQAGTLAYGLRPDSRIQLKAANLNMPITQMIMMRAADELSIIRWLNTTDGAKGVNRPTLLSEMLLDKTDSAEGYDTPEEFMRAYYGE